MVSNKASGVIPGAATGPGSRCAPAGVPGSKVTGHGGGEGATSLKREEASQGPNNHLLQIRLSL